MALPGSFPPPSLDELLTFLATLTDQQFSEIEGEVLSPSAFEADADRVATIAARLQVNRATIGFLLTFLEFFYSRLISDATSSEDRFQTIERLVSSSKFRGAEAESQKAIARDRLMRLTTENRYAKLRRKIDRLKTGFIPSGVAFSTFVDLRPMISEDRNSIDGFVPVVQLRISTEQGDDESTTVVQLDEKALSKLSEAVDDASKKLRLIKDDDFFKSRIVN